MFKQTIRFERAQDAFVFDQYMIDFLRACDETEDEDDACVFTTSLQDAEAYIRVVQTDSAQMLGARSPQKLWPGPTLPAAGLVP